MIGGLAPKTVFPGSCSTVCKSMQTQDLRQMLMILLVATFCGLPSPHVSFIQIQKMFCGNQQNSRTVEATPNTPNKTKQNNQAARLTYLLEHPHLLFRCFWFGGGGVVLPLSSSSDGIFSFQESFFKLATFSCYSKLPASDIEQFRGLIRDL